MNYPMYSIRDIKTCFLAPNCDQSDQSAIRNFAYAINDKGVMNYSPKDFDLYKVGEYDSETGVITGCLPELICQGINVIGEK